MIDLLYNLLKIIGFNEPVHPPITHMPIGLTIGAFIFLVVGLVFKKQRLVLTARYVAILAFIFIFPTIIFGVFDWIHFYNAVLMPAIVIKMVLAAIVLLCLGAVAIFGGEGRLPTFWTVFLLAIAFVGVIGLGYYGSGILYGRAVSVAPAPAPKGSVSADATATPAYAAGRDVFAANCQACHAQGLNAIVASLPLKSSAKLQHLDSFVAFVRNPTMPDGSAGQMPPFDTSTLPDKQLSELYTYVTKAWK